MLMNNLFDFSKWKKFKVGDILQRKKIKSVSSIIGDLEDGNDIVVGNSAINNGVIQYKNITDKIYINPSNVLSYGAKGGKFFYQSKQWSSTDHVHMFVSEKLNEYTQSFLCTVLNHMLKVKGGWQSSLESSVLDEIIMLPSDNSGNPDWQFMEDYIKALRERERERESTELAECYEVKQLQPFEQIKWKEFLLNQIFKFEKGKCSNAPDLEDGNDIPYVGAKKTENGIMKWVKLEQNLVSKGNAISFICQGEGSNGYCNYFDIDTIQTTSNTLAYNPKLNKFNALFLVTLLDLERPKWSFGRGRSPKLGETKIKLPINSQNEIDWQYMEDYVKALRERERERVRKLF